MTKLRLLSLAAVAGAAGAVDERPPRRRLVEPLAPKRADGAGSATRREAGDALRREAPRALQGRHGGGKGGKEARSGPRSGPGDRWTLHSPDRPGRVWDDDDRWRDDDWYHGGKGGKSGGGGGSGKSGKSGGGRSDDRWDDDWGHDDDDWHRDPEWGPQELFYILPTACPHECISSHVTGDHYEFVDSLKQCQDRDESQMWYVRSDGSYVAIESYYDRGMCIAVDYEHGDGESSLAKTCHNGELVLKDCRSDYGTEWYFTGGQLINALCWGAGLSSMMTVFLEEKDGDVVKECKKDVAAWGANDEAVLKSDTFLFVSRLPQVPFRIDDVEDAIKQKTTKTTTTSKDTSKSRMGTIKADVEGLT